LSNALLRLSLPTAFYRPLSNAIHASSLPLTAEHNCPLLTTAHGFLLTASFHWPSPLTAHGLLLLSNAGHASPLLLTAPHYTAPLCSPQYTFTSSRYPRSSLLNTAAPPPFPVPDPFPGSVSLPVFVPVLTTLPVAVLTTVPVPVPVLVLTQTTLPVNIALPAAASPLIVQRPRTTRCYSITMTSLLNHFVKSAIDILTGNPPDPSSLDSPLSTSLAIPATTSFPRSAPSIQEPSSKTSIVTKCCTQCGKEGHNMRRCPETKGKRNREDDVEGQKKSPRINTPRSSEKFGNSRYIGEHTPALLRRSTTTGSPSPDLRRLCLVCKVKRVYTICLNCNVGLCFATGDGIDCCWREHHIPKLLSSTTN
jgi:hypothetical protein